MDDPRLAELLLDWQEALEQGRDIPPAEICRDCPELAERLAQQIAVLRKMDRVLALEDSGEGIESPLVPAASVSQPRLPQVPGHQLVREIGHGGMGVVYLARHMRLNRPVALKMVRWAQYASADELERFRREAEAIAGLQHPNIVQIYDVGEHDGMPYLSLEFCEGGSLDKRLNGTPISPSLAVEWVETLARVVHAAHAAGIVHRDLKPANVLLAGDVLKITDFGLAKKLEGGETWTQTGWVLGTPSYMAPEQARGQSKHVGLLADVYALGAILYECLTGRPPFRAATPAETVLQVLNEEPVSVRSLLPGVRRDLEAICLKCLQKEPNKRYASAAELAQDLDRFRRGVPIFARPVGRWERAHRWARRNPVVAGLGTMIAGLLVLGTAVSTYFAINASRNESVATQNAERATVALNQATNQRRRADDRFRQALGAVGDVIRKLESPEFRNRPQFQPFREDLRKIAFDGLQDIFAEKSDDPIVRWEQGCAHIYEGDLHTAFGDADKSVRAYQRAVATLKAVVSEYPVDAVYQEELGQAYNHLGDALWEGGRRKEASEALGLALQHYRKAVELRPNDYRGINYLAWLLTVCKDKRLRDYSQAVKYAKDLTTRLAPSSAGCWKTLGVAYYNRGDWDSARAALTRSMELHSLGLKFYDWYYLSMVSSKQGKHCEAREWYEKAHAWARQNRPGNNDDAQRLDEEAKKLLHPELALTVLRVSTLLLLGPSQGQGPLFAASALFPRRTPEPHVSAGVQAGQ